MYNIIKNKLIKQITTTTNTKAIADKEFLEFRWAHFNLTSVGVLVQTNAIFITKLSVFTLPTLYSLPAYMYNHKEHVFKYLPC